jgi:hypothetical protein
LGVSPGFVVTATAAANAGPVELTLRMTTAADDAAAHPRGKHGRSSAPDDRRDEERGMDFSPEEADGDAIAAETGAAV